MTMRDTRGIRGDDGALYVPGRGPLHTRRPMPEKVPVARADLVAQGMGWRKIDRLYVPSGPGMLVPRDTVGAGLPTGEDAGPFRHDIVTRARSQVRPDGEAVVGFWAALAGHGLPRWADTEPVVLHVGSRSRGSLVADVAARTPLLATLRPRPADLPTTRPDPCCPYLQVVTAPVATAQCLTTVIAGKKAWHAPEVPGLDRRTVNGVQLLDAVLQCTVLSPDDLLSGAANRVRRDRMERLIALADDGAQSPRETVLRLMVRDSLPPGFTWSSQVPVAVSEEWWGTRSTVPDLACEDLKVALYYDGGHHGTGEQKSTDFDLFQRLRDLGWEPVRIDKALMKKYVTMMETVDNAVLRAYRRYG
jgi:very-short-patch-repair endonuclease